ncbi:hypothetical protein D3C86_1729510 [compost metagenome]
MSIQHQTAADAGPQSDKGEIVDPLPDTQPALAENGEIDVVFDHGFEAKGGFERTSNIHLIEAGNIGSKQYATCFRLRRTGGTDHGDAQF